MPDLDIFKGTDSPTLSLDLRILSTREQAISGTQKTTKLIMNRSLICVLFIAVTLVISVTCQPDAMLAPPDRPSEFRTPGDLRRYLKALNDYYAIVGRPRFGRSADKQTFRQAYGQQSTGNDYGYFWNDALSRDQYDSAGDDGMSLFEF